VFCVGARFCVERGHMLGKGGNDEVVACPARVKLLRLEGEYKRTWGQGGDGGRGLGGLDLNPHPPEGGRMRGPKAVLMG
jgi:hypothetical protein